MREFTQEDIGKTLLFKILACAYAVPRGVIRRKIVGVDFAGRPLVRFAGYSDFVVNHREVKGVE